MAVFDRHSSTRASAVRRFIAVAVLVGAAVPAGASAGAQYGDIPLTFESNRGQAPDPVRFQARSIGYMLMLEDSGARMWLRNGKEQPELLQISLAGGKKVTPIAESALPGHSNYLSGSNPDRWILKVPHFRKIRYSNVYPGVDWVYYGNQRDLEYDFVVAPGADPNRIAMRIDGARRLSVDADGDLILEMRTGTVRQRKPLLYQETSSGRRIVKGDYRVNGRLVSFRVGQYDRTEPLVIDPVLGYWNFVGGTNSEIGEAIAIDPSRNAYITGHTMSPAVFPVVAAAQSTYGGGGSDAFVTKINAAGNAIVFSTYLGGSADDAGHGIAVDSAGNAYVTGETASVNFPTLGPFRGAQGGVDAFVTKLSSTGSIVYSTYLGAAGTDIGRAVAVDSSNAYVTGTTNSTTGFAGLSNANSGLTDAFVIKLTPAGNGVVYGVYVGGNGSDAAFGIALDRQTNSYITGQTTSTSIAPTPGSFQTGNAGGNDGFVAKLNSSGARQYWAYYGGTGFDLAKGIAVDSLGNAYIGGETTSTSIPTQNAFQPAYGGGIRDGFVAKLNSFGSGLVWSTFLGGANDDAVSAVALIGDTVFAGGLTLSTNFPLIDTIKPVESTNYDGFVSRFSSSGSSLSYSTRLGGNSTDMVFGIAADTEAAAYVTGFSLSTNITSTIPGNVIRGPQDAFVSKVRLLPSLAVDQSQLYFGVTPGASGTARTGPQQVRVITFPSVSWTATSNQPHIRVTPAAGTGSGNIQISLDPAPGPPLASGAVTITAPTASIGSPQVIQVNIASTTPQPPFGSVDTPAQGAANLTGAIGVTGWVLDNIEVTNVRIFRDPVPGEPFAPGTLVLVADGIFLPGARPDVEALNPTAPLRNRAGWGALILTNTLPNSTGSGPPGNGTYRFTVIAYDREGLTTVLAARTVSVNNAASTRPFGVLDTPQPGETVSGVINVFGWVLTPPPCAIPSGSSIVLFVDGQPVGLVLGYGGPRPDIAALFPTYANASGPNGVIALDTTSLRDGLHSIAWSAQDNCGRIEGIGSRTFYVQNGGMAPASAPAPALAKMEDPAAKQPPAASFARAMPLLVRRGFGDEGLAETLYPSSEGVIAVKIGQAEKVELSFGVPLAEGYIKVASGSAPLPEGASLDVSNGRFSWIPPIEASGQYELEFIRAGEGREAVRVLLTIGN